MTPAPVTSPERDNLLSRILGLGENDVRRAGFGTPDTGAVEPVHAHRDGQNERGT